MEGYHFAASPAFTTKAYCYRKLNNYRLADENLIAFLKATYGTTLQMTIPVEIFSSLQMTASTST
jgi:hypothetical protein